MATRKVKRETRSQDSPSDETIVMLSAPVVFEVKKKKKRGSSRTARRLEDVEKRLSKAARRVSRGVRNGVEEYIDNRDRSERKRRDGALVDFFENVSKGTARAISESSPVLTDFAEALNTRRMRKQIRRTLRSIPMIL
jgi:hypothetical protein